MIDATLKLAAVGVTRQDVTERDMRNLEESRALAEGLADEARLAQVSTGSAASPTSAGSRPRPSRTRSRACRSPSASATRASPPRPPT